MSEIMIAPLSHNPLRDWPAAHYTALIDILLDRLPADVRISLIGSPNQRLTLNHIIRTFPADRVVSTCGLSWNTVLARVRRADCVIGNNSGITHLAGYFGTPSVCIFGGSHQRSEWAPLRSNVTVLTREIACSPCQYHQPDQCRHGIACLDLIAPATVAQAVMNAVRAHQSDSNPAHRAGGA